MKLSGLFRVLGILVSIVSAYALTVSLMNSRMDFPMLFGAILSVLFVSLIFVSSVLGSVPGFIARGLDRLKKIADKNLK